MTLLKLLSMIGGHPRLKQVVVLAPIKNSRQYLKSHRFGLPFDETCLLLSLSGGVLKVLPVCTDPVPIISEVSDLLLDMPKCRKNTKKLDNIYFLVVGCLRRMREGWRVYRNNGTVLKVCSSQDRGYWPIYFAFSRLEASYNRPSMIHLIIRFQSLLKV